MLTELSFDSSLGLSNSVRSYDLGLPLIYQPGRELGSCSEEQSGLLRETLQRTTGVIIQLSGRFGRVGESVITSAYIYPIHEVLLKTGKYDTPITVVVDRAVAPLYLADLLTENLGREVRVKAVEPALSNFTVQNMLFDESGNLMVFDFNGGNESKPAMTHMVSRTKSGNKETVVLSNLFRSAVRAFASMGPERRYSSFIETLFSMPSGSLDTNKAQPTILFGEKDAIRQKELWDQLSLDPKALTLLCFFQSAVPAKCYGRWQEVLDGISNYVHAGEPGRGINCVLACGPEGPLKQRYTKSDLEKQFGDYSGVGNISINVCQLPSLRDVAIVAAGSDLVLSNDTGPAHIAGAVRKPVVVPFLPGNVITKDVWATSLTFRGVTLDPSPYSNDRVIEAYHQDDFGIIDSISPSLLLAPAVESLHL